MSDKKSETKELLGDMLADTGGELFRWLRKCAIYAVIGAILLGGITYFLIGEIWFGVKMGALLGLIVAIGLRWLFAPSFFD